jgi:hypothetical protein
MLVYRPRHEIDCTPARFWELYLDSDFQNRLYLEGLGWERPEITIERDDEDEFRRTMIANPKVMVSGVVEKLIKHTLGFVETGVFDRKAGVFRLKHRTNIFGDKFRLEGEMRIDPVGEHRCRRVAKLEAESYVFGIGRIIEKAAEGNMKKGWDDSAVFFNRWVAKHPEDAS